ncbi:MAG: hypothetical protein IPL43_01740 [Micropruina sp.]|nr:hypothetical protein [Micropruina sp.]
MEELQNQDASTARVMLLGLVDAVFDEHAAQVRQVEFIRDLCVVFSALDRTPPVLPGQERLIPCGADGTPLVAEHLATEIGPLLRMSIERAGMLIADSMNLIVRHPLLWAATRANRVTVWQAKQIARTTAEAGLSQQAAAWVDEQIEPALGHLAGGRLRRRLAGLIARADVELATKKAAQARQARFVRITHNGDGTAFIVARTDAVDALRLNTMLTQIAGQLRYAGDTNDHDVLRATALGVLADPGQAIALLAGPDDTDTGEGQPHKRRKKKSRPKAELVVHFTPGEHVGRCDQLGPVLAEQIRGWLGHHHVTVRPVIDLSDNPAVDAYEIPTPIARITRWRNPFDIFPYASRASTGLDLDHTIPYDHSEERPAGQTNPNNLGPTSRRPHRAKTHSGWEVSQPFPGIFYWTSRLGFRYQVDATGSQQLPDDQKPGQPVPTTEDGRGPRPAHTTRTDLTWPKTAPNRLVLTLP